MYKIVITLLILIVAASYVLPADLVKQIPQGSNMQRFTKQAVSWSFTTINDATNGWFTNTFNNLRQRGKEEIEEAKEDIKDSVKDIVDKKIDEGIEAILP